MSTGFGRRVDGAAVNGLWESMLRARELAIGSLVNTGNDGVRVDVGLEWALDFLFESFLLKMEVKPMLAECEWPCKCADGERIAVAILFFVCGKVRRWLNGSESSSM